MHPVGKRKLNQTDIESTPLSIELTPISPLRDLPRDLWVKIFEQLTIPKLAAISLVSKQWRSMSYEAQINSINKKKLSFVKIFRPVFITQRYDIVPLFAIEWLLKNPFHSRLSHLDFRILTQKDMERLTQACPNLSSIAAVSSKLKNLETLNALTALRSLDLNSSRDLEPDALQNFQHLSSLESLKLTYCRQSLKQLAAASALKSLNLISSDIIPEEMHYLSHVSSLTCLRTDDKGENYLPFLPNLTRLDLWNVHGTCLVSQFSLLSRLTKIDILSARKLQNLQFLSKTTLLKKLSLSCCDKIERTALSALCYVTNLLTLHINCTVLEKDALKNIAHTPQLRKLKWTRMEPVPSLEPLQFTTELIHLEIMDTTVAEQAFYALRHVTKLRTLIAERTKSSRSKLNFLCYTPLLQRLAFPYNQIDSLLPLQFVTQLTELDITYNSKLPPTALVNLRFTPYLTKLNIQGNKQLEPDALSHLSKVSGLKNLSIIENTQWKRQVLSYLALVPHLEKLNLIRTSNLGPLSKQTILKDAPCLQKVIHYHVE